MPVNSKGVDDENLHTSENFFISGMRLLVLINELSKYKSTIGRGSGITEQEMDSAGTV